MIHFSIRVIRWSCTKLGKKPAWQRVNSCAGYFYLHINTPSPGTSGMAQTSPSLRSNYVFTVSHSVHWNKCWEFPLEARRPTSERPTANIHHIRASAHRSPIQHRNLCLPLISVHQDRSFTFTEAGKTKLKDRTWRSPQNQGMRRAHELSGDWTLCMPHTYFQVPGCEILYLVDNLLLAGSVSP